MNEKTIARISADAKKAFTEMRKEKGMTADGLIRLLMQTQKEKDNG